MRSSSCLKEKEEEKEKRRAHGVKGSGVASSPEPRGSAAPGAEAHFLFRLADAVTCPLWVTAPCPDDDDAPAADEDDEDDDDKTHYWHSRSGKST